MLRHFIPRNDNRVFAFTLAEVLITFTIIGVIAALTIPSLMIKWQQKEMEAGFQKAWALANTAVKKTYYDLGITNMLEDVPESQLTDAIDTLYKNFNIDTTKTKYYDFSSWYNSYVELHNYAGTCYVAPQGRLYLTGNMLVGIRKESDRLMLITIDANGPKKPNRFGYDMWQFSIKGNSGNIRFSQNERTHLQPYQSNGWPGMPNNCTKTTVHTGGGSCGYWALINKNPDNQSQNYWQGLDFKVQSHYTDSTMKNYYCVYCKKY